ncbi:T9SS type A sorting domain-containing protein [Lacibacter luteus]|uniref:T9SS type A sorting domain-containing protein n=1 Tax=Lacibacter luteus TaxID=2508719 RepID=A0A4Q1CLB4_9BACT|nr:T9SS type A sorting domain-containing protein [Lacibacter luteus]RXK61783.1 T9SS type A sorting domain-containing protein [Lacibacter luteus]
MKQLYLAFVFLCFISSTKAQSVIQFTVNQLPLLKADAGKDSTVIKGSSIVLGGISPASGGSGTYTYAWSPATGLDKTDISHPTATVNQDITYTLTINDGLGCIKTSAVNLKVSFATSVDEFSALYGLRIFPNPVSDRIYIRTSRAFADKLLLLELYDVHGRKVYARQVNGTATLNQTIELGSFSKGLYLLKFTSTKINTAYKIIVQ